MDNTLLIAVLVLLSVNTLLLLGTAGAVSKLIGYITEKENEPVVGSVTTDDPDKGLKTLQDERGDRWGRHMSYGIPNDDGMNPRFKNYDGVGNALTLIDRDEDDE